MPNILIYNPTTKKVQSYLHSVDEQEYLSRIGIDVIVSPNLPLCSQQYMIVENNAVREMTQEEKSVFDIENAPKLTFEGKLRELTKNGYLDPITDIKIRGGDEEMTRRWAPSITSILNMKSLGLPGATPFQFTDFDDVPHTMTFDEFQQLMARYSVWFNEQFANASSP